jgi:hypothetical protein
MDHKGRSGWVRKILSSLQFDLRTIDTVASCYTDCAITAFDKYYVLLHYVMNTAMFQRALKCPYREQDKSSPVPNNVLRQKIL